MLFGCTDYLEKFDNAYEENNVFISLTDGKFKDERDGNTYFGKFFLEFSLDSEQLLLLDGGQGVVERALLKVEYRGRVDVGAVELHLEMQVRPEGAARIAADADGIAGLERVADVDFPAGEVGVEGGEPVPVVQNDVLAVTPAAALVAYLGDDTGECGHDGAVFAVAEPEVDAAVHAVGTDAVGGGNATAFARDKCRSHVEDELGQGIHMGGIGGVHVGGEFRVGFFLAHFGAVIGRVGFVFGNFGRGVGIVACIGFVYESVSGKLAFGLRNGFGYNFVLGKCCQGYHADYRKDF